MLDKNDSLIKQDLASINSETLVDNTSSPPKMKTITETLFGAQRDLSQKTHSLDIKSINENNQSKTQMVSSITSMESMCTTLRKKKMIDPRSAVQNSTAVGGAQKASDSI